MRDRIILAAAMAAALAPVPAMADARNDVMAGMIRCAALADDRQWLDCYYGAAQPMRAQLGLTPAPQSQMRLLSAQPAAPMRAMPPAMAAAPAVVASAAPMRSGPPPMERHSGLLNFSGGEDVVTNMPVASYELNKGGFVITLSNGEVWEQTGRDGVTNPAHWRQPASTMRVTISQGAVHTFNLVVNNENQHFKVDRIR